MPSEMVFSMIILFAWRPISFAAGRVSWFVIRIVGFSWPRSAMEIWRIGFCYP